MKRRDWPRAFGPTPDDFRALVENTLREEEKPVRKLRFTPILVAALLTLLLAATALAIANRAGLREFIGEGDSAYGVDLSHRMGGSEPLVQKVVGDLEVTVTEAAGDGRNYYFTITIAPRPGVKEQLRTLMDIWDFPKDDNGRELPNTTPFPVLLTEDTYVVDAYMTTSNTGNSILNEDGSVSFLSDPVIFTLDDTAEMTCIVVYGKRSAGQSLEGMEVETVEIPFTVDTVKALEKKHNAGPVTLGDTGITVDTLYLKRTETETVARLYLRYLGGEGVAYKMPEGFGGYGQYGISIRMLDTESGTPYEMAAQNERNRYNVTWYGGNRFLIERKPLMETLPQSVTIEVYDTFAERVLATEIIPLVDGGPESSRLDAYTHDEQYPVDPEEYLVSPDDPREMIARVSTPDGKPTEVRLDPADPDSVIMTVNSGASISPVHGTRDGWVLVWIASQFDMAGYIPAENYAAGDDIYDVIPGVPMAEILPKDGDHVDVRKAPSDDSYIFAKLDKGLGVRVLCTSGIWCYVECDGGEGGRTAGYVPADALRLTGQVVPVSGKVVYQEDSAGE